ncbi:MAG: PAS domain S-box protein, partial [Chloroflexia bacterium]
MLDSDQSDKSLYLTEAKYRMLVEQSPDGIAIYDRQGRFSEVNNRTCEMLGYTREELYKKRVPDVIAPEDLARQPLRFDELTSGRPLMDERLLLRKDGTHLPVELSARMLSDGTFQVIVRDITARKQAEEEIRLLNTQLEERVRQRTEELENANRDLRNEIAERQRAEEALRITQTQLRRLVESNIIGILVGDFSGNALYANDALLDMLGYTRAEFDAGAMQWGNITPPEYAHMGIEATRRLRETGVSGSYEKIYRHKDGRLISALVGAARLDDTSNIAIAYIVDISERKKLEEQLRIREREISTLIDNSPDIIIRLDLNMRPLYVN